MKPTPPLRDDDEPIWLTSDEAAAYLRMPSTRALYQAVRHGLVPVHRVGRRRLRFHRAELEQTLLATR